MSEGSGASCSLGLPRGGPSDQVIPESRPKKRHKAMWVWVVWRIAGVSGLERARRKAARNVLRCVRRGAARSWGPRRWGKGWGFPLRWALFFFFFWEKAILREKNRIRICDWIRDWHIQATDKTARSVRHSHQPQIYKRFLEHFAKSSFLLFKNGD